MLLHVVDRMWRFDQCKRNQHSTHYKRGKLLIQVSELCINIGRSWCQPMTTLEWHLTDNIYMYLLEMLHHMKCEHTLQLVNTVLMWRWSPYTCVWDGWALLAPCRKRTNHFTWLSPFSYLPHIISSNTCLRSCPHLLLHMSTIVLSLQRPLFLIPGEVLVSFDVVITLVIDATQAFI